MAPKIFTYHCNYCSHLLLATTHDISTLPHRKAPGLDNATILPLPPAPREVANNVEGDNSESEYTSESDSESEQTNAADASGVSQRKRSKRKDYTLLISCPKETKARIITREDGFEKRFLHKCGRCKLPMGYQLDDAQFDVAQKGKDGQGSEKGVQPKKKKRTKYLYVLPGSLVSSQDLDGKEPDDDEIDILH
ncbi:hypothetical protein BJ508DRAFT_64255 [Ascobolus immersus RN42]|uniref:STEEP1 domain-containing protein n=1 Tax=Ascobolus immersus RN42 TaxID=1160509 RepID=A0A3N4IPB5_ASCIM|nr:hypothetical protein BJ508DRAFT_64255 [Ascobolus immersus RN42]